MRRLTLRVDGAARGNPGPAGAGWVVETPEGTVVEDGCAYLGERTNNQAEYEALIRALEAVDPDSETTLTVYSDSELLVRQLNGEYRVKNPGLLERHRRATRRLSRAAGWTIRHVDREENRDADALANQAIDAYALEGEASGEA